MSDPDNIIQDLSPDLDKVVMELGKSLVDIADYMVDRIRINTPVDTGRLRNSVVWTKLSTRGQNTMTVEVGSNVVYAPHIEWGTKFIDARRMFRTGIDLTEPWAVNRIEKALTISANS